MLRRPPVDPFEQVSKLRRRDGHRTFGRRRPYEATALQALREQARALAVVPNHLDQVTAAAPEDEPVDDDEQIAIA